MTPAVRRRLLWMKRHAFLYTNYLIWTGPGADMTKEWLELCTEYMPVGDLLSGSSEEEQAREAFSTWRREGKDWK